MTIADMTTTGRLVDAERGVISREIFVNDGIFAEELEKLFARAWLFVGHESQIPEPGDYFTSRMGDRVGDPVPRQNATYSCVSEHLPASRHEGVPLRPGQHAAFHLPLSQLELRDRRQAASACRCTRSFIPISTAPQWSLIEVPRMVNYKGAIFASWDPRAPEFVDYLGDVKDHLDQVLDCRDGREGGSEVFGGIHKWIIPANWKFAAENFCGDTYHNPSHRSVDLIGIGPSSAKAARPDGATTNTRAGGMSGSASRPGTASTACGCRRTRPMSKPSRTTRSSPIISATATTSGRAGSATRRGCCRSPARSFPNASYHGRQPRALCVWHPVSATQTEVWRFFLVDRDAPAEVKDLLRRYYMRYAGPAGMTEQDDMENWNYATAASRGTIARRYPYNYQASLGRARDNDPVPGNVSTQVTEENARGFYRSWQRYLDGADWPALIGRPAQPETRAAAE